LVETVAEKADKQIKEHPDRASAIKSLVVAQREHNMLHDEIKGDDLYYINRILSEYNLVLSLEFSKILMSVSCMYSLLTLLNINTHPEEYTSEASFFRYQQKKGSRIVFNTASLSETGSSE
jgi:hypothetical protein